MNKVLTLRVLIATGLLVSGLLLTPFIALPSERFGWERFAGIYGYQQTPTVASTRVPLTPTNHLQGTPTRSATLQTTPGTPEASATPTLTPIPLPKLHINYEIGRPGSYFTVTGSGFDPNQSVDIVINGRALGTLMTDGNGELLVILDTTQADLGVYVTVATSDLQISATSEPVTFVLDLEAPLRPKEADGPIIIVPKGLAGRFLQLPVIIR